MKRLIHYRQRIVLNHVNTRLIIINLGLIQVARFLPAVMVRQRNRSARFDHQPTRYARRVHRAGGKPLQHDHGRQRRRRGVQLTPRPDALSPPRPWGRVAGNRALAACHGVPRPDLQPLRMPRLWLAMWTRYRLWSAALLAYRLPDADGAASRSMRFRNPSMSSTGRVCALAEGRPDP